MSRIGKLFETKKRDLLNIYFTAGYPYIDSTREIMRALEENGADLIEIGMPYSDPLADGPVIQESSVAAIRNGMTINRLFNQLKGFRNEIKVPVLLMGYMNPVLQYGFEKFCSDASKLGIDGIILPDLPEKEFVAEFGPIIKKYGLDFIFLVTPETPEERVRKLDALSTGFLYAVSASSTTGKEQNAAEVKKFLEKLEHYRLKNPVLLGFGIKDKQGYQLACGSASGGIIGSAYIRTLSSGGNIKQVTRQFLASIKN